MKTLVTLAAILACGTAVAQAPEDTAYGQFALYKDAGGGNSAFGYYASMANTSGVYNSSFGFGALAGNTSGGYNVAMGYASLGSEYTGSHNIGIGGSSLYHASTGSYNIGIGSQAGFYMTFGSNNIYLANAGSQNDSAVIRIGTQGTQLSTYIAGIRGTKITNGLAVLVDSKGHLGTATGAQAPALNEAMIRQIVQEEVAKALSVATCR